MPFTMDNTQGFTESDLAVMNAAIRHFDERSLFGADDWQEADIRQSWDEAVLASWEPGIDAANLYQAAAERLGLI